MRTLLHKLARLLRAALRTAWAEERELLGDVARTTRAAARAQQAAAEQQRADTARIGQQLGELASARDVLGVRKELTELRRSLSVHARATTRALRYAELLDEQGLWYQQIERRIERATARGVPVIAGPWTGEVGFELLYWIPFLRAVQRRLSAAGTPLIVLARGGSGTWYRDFAAEADDVFDVVDVATFRAGTEGETRKQRTVRRFDRRLLHAVRERRGLTRPEIVHPAFLYRLLYRYWKDQLPARVLFEHLAFDRLSPPAVPATLPPLPARFVAVRFYFSDCFPDTTENRAFAHGILATLAEQGPVVLLGTPFQLDDHVDLGASGQVVSVSQAMTPANNLAVQSAVIARASAFVGTYGGFSYLAPFYGVRSLAFYDQPTFFPQHLDVARRAFDAIGAPALTAVRTSDADLVRSVLAPARIPS